MKKVLLFLTVMLCSAQFVVAASKKDPLATWQPKFDPSTAKYTYLLSSVAHPAIDGVSVGYRIRDKVWERSGGKIYVDYRPLGQLGGEKDVISKLKLGAVNGMIASSVASANIADKLGVVNLPYVVNTFDKLDTFRNTPELWEPFANAPRKSKIVVADFTGYGPYGWATTSKISTLADAKSVNFRIAQAPVNIDTYKAWGLKFTVMPWPDVPQALQTGVISGLDHTAIVCNMTKKFTIARYFTELNYAQGLYLHLVNTRWLNKLPKDLQKVFLDVIKEESADTRARTRAQFNKQVADAKAHGVTFTQLPAADVETLKKEAIPVIEKWGKKIGPDYLQAVTTTLGK